MFLSSTMKKSLLRVMQAEGGSSFALFTGCFHYIKVPSRSFPLFPLRRLTPCQGGKSDEVRRQFEKISSRTSTFAKKHRREINADEAGPRVTRDPRADDGWFLGISFDPTTNGRRKARRTAFGRRKTMEHGPWSCRHVALERIDHARPGSSKTCEIMRLRRNQCPSPSLYGVLCCCKQHLLVGGDEVVDLQAACACNTSTSICLSNNASGNTAGLKIQV